MSCVSASEPKTNSNMGTVCVVTNAAGVRSYVIGTCHFADKESIEKSFFHQIIDRCSCLYSEVGDIGHSFCHLADQPKYKDITYRFHLDQFIEQAASRRNTSVYSLDSDVPEMGAIMSSVSETRRCCAQNTEEESLLVDAYMQEAIENVQDPSYTVTHDNIKKGNVGALLAERVQAQDLVEETFSPQREEHWAKRLIPALKDTGRPICIAVGASHLVGENCLIERFKNAGFKVEFLRHPSWTQRTVTYLKKNSVSRLLSKIKDACKAALHLMSATSLPLWRIQR